MDRNDQTIATYRENFDTYIDRTPKEIEGEFKEWIDAFIRALPTHARVFEIGSAFGRDARYLASHGLRVLCTDVVPQALQQLAKEGFETAEYDFRDDPKEEWLGQFDGFFANACYCTLRKQFLRRHYGTSLRF